VEFELFLEQQALFAESIMRVEGGKERREVAKAPMGVVTTFRVLELRSKEGEMGKDVDMEM